MIIDRLTLRQRLTWLAHFWKALSQQHHREMAAVFRPYLPADGVVLDVGAHSGQFTKLLAAMVPQGRVHAFEPGSYPLSILRRVVAWRGLRNVSVHPWGLGEREETLTLRSPLKRSGSIGFGLSVVGAAAGDGRQSVSETVHIRRLDDVARELGLVRADLIKADIEGSELRMLMGAEETLRRFGPAIYLEVNDAALARRGDSAAALASYLKDLGYAPADGWDTFRPDADILFVRA